MLEHVGELLLELARQDVALTAQRQIHLGLL